MNYNEFKIAMTEQVSNLVGEEVNVTMRQVRKNNGVEMEGLVIMDRTTNISPTIYLEPFFRKHLQGVSMERLAQLLVKEYEVKRLPEKVDPNLFLDFSRIRHKICFKLISYDKNRTLLSEIPHVRYLDLALVFFYSVEEILNDAATILLRNCDMERWKTTPAELELLARENTPKLHPLLFLDIEDLMEELMEGIQSKADGEKTEQPFDFGLSEALPMYILTNKDKVNGAGVICYPGMLEAMAEFIGGAFFVLPSSIHEVIITPDSGQFTPKELTEMVTDINRTEVDPVEVLSDHAYRYDPAEGKLTI